MTPLHPEDHRLVRDLARRLAALADQPVMAQRRDLWRRHNDLEQVRPVIYIDPQGAWGELIPEETLICREKPGRDVERLLRRRIYLAEHFASDNVLEKEWVVRRVFSHSGWGLTPRRHRPEEARGAFGFEPVIQSPADLAKLKVPEIVPEPTATAANLAFFQELFGDLLNVRLKGVDDLSYHLMNQFTALRGLQEVLVDMIENPQFVHDAMAFLEQGHREVRRQYIEHGLLSLNNDNSPIYTSGYGYTAQLPAPGFAPDRVRPRDMWGWAEAQEMAVVSPDMHAEFAFPYEKRLLEPFGLNGYGCCDDVTRKLDFVLTIPRLRRVSVSPWADVARCAERLKGDVILMWKPQPAHLVGEFNPTALRAYLRHGVAATRACGGVLEIVLLDTHTCENHPERFDQWARIAHEVVTE